LDLLPIADTKYLDERGYATAHYFAPDFDLGTNASLIALVNKIPGRLILDTVMAFGSRGHCIIQLFDQEGETQQIIRWVAEPASHRACQVFSFFGG
jgi:1,4-alpha-glucan branching enzyme